MVENNIVNMVPFFQRFLKQNKENNIWNLERLFLSQIIDSFQMALYLIERKTDKMYETTNFN